MSPSPSGERRGKGGADRKKMGRQEVPPHLPQPTMKVSFTTPARCRAEVFSCGCERRRSLLLWRAEEKEGKDIMEHPLSNKVIIENTLKLLRCFLFLRTLTENRPSSVFHLDTGHTLPKENAEREKKRWERIH